MAMTQTRNSIGFEEQPDRGRILPTFDHIFEEFERPIYDYLLHLIQNQADAEDLAQETFIRVHDKLETFRGEARLSTWIYRIATNISTDYFRSSAHRQAKANPLLEEVDLDREFANLSAPSVAQQVAQSDMSDCMQKFVQHLPYSYRTVIVLHDLQGLKAQEIADILECPLETVKIRLHRARVKLRASLHAGCDLDHDERNVMVCEPNEVGKATLE
jgi:RNA polymerase sigma-70 factor (ECF subfamily)